MNYKFSAREAINFAWSKVQADFGKYFGLGFLFFIIQAFPAFLKDIPLVGILAQIVSMIAVWIFYMGMTRISLGVIEGKAFQVMDSMKFEMNQFIQYVGASIICGLIYIGGFLLLIIPGFIWLCKYYFPTFIVMDKNIPVIEAVKESGRITQGHKIKVFYLLLLLFAVNMLGMICLLIGLCITLPMSWVAVAYAYRKLSPSPNAS